MFYVAATIASLIIGFALLVVWGFITPKNENGWVIKLFLLMVGVMIFTIAIKNGVYDGAGKPIPFPAEPGYYDFQLTKKNTDEVAGIITFRERNSDNLIEKFVVIPRKAISNDELLENSKVSSLKVTEEVKGYKKIVLR